jgi:hypothetical protein
LARSRRFNATTAFATLSGGCRWLFTLAPPLLRRGLGGGLLSIGLSGTCCTTSVCSLLRLVAAALAVLLLATFGDSGVSRGGHSLRPRIRARRNSRSFVDRLVGDDATFLSSTLVGDRLWRPRLRRSPANWRVDNYCRIWVHG